ncbi:MAG: glycine zipper 2TM domain-containing protein [Steroidobacteraceae bacterium]
MNNSLLAGLIVGAVVVTAVGAVAANSGFNPLQKYAKVVSVEPAYETNRIPRQVCGDQATLEQAPVKDEKRIAGTAIGAVVGGVLGSQVGSGSGRDAATVAGAAAGGYAGSKIQKRMQQGNVQETTEEQCVTVYDTESVQAGYDVTYELDGVQEVVRMDKDPGERIPVEDGELVLSRS